MQTLKRYLDLVFKTTIAFFVFVIFFATASGVQSYWHEQRKAIDVFSAKKYIVIGETVVSVAIADTAFKRENGLSFVNSLESGKGMLFLFDKMDFHPMWMKDMNFPLDIIWISSNLQVVHLEERVSPRSYPKQFIPEQKALYVLEVPSGFIEKEGIKIGDLLILF